MIVTTTPTSLVTSSLLFLYWPFVEIKNKNQVSANWWSVNKKNPVFYLQWVTLFFKGFVS